MKLALKLSFFFFTLISFDYESFSLSYYRIKKICKKEKRESNCIKELKEKRFNLQKGNFIEIPVIPYKQ